LSNEAVKKIKKLDRMIWGNWQLVEKRAFWVLCYCYFINGKDEVIRWKQLEEAKLMANETLAWYLSELKTNGYLEKMKTRSGTFYKLKDKAKQLMEQQLNEAELLLQLKSRNNN